MSAMASNPLAAMAAADACRSVAAALMAARMVRGEAAKRARSEWQGPHRQRFDRLLADLDGEAEHLVKALRVIADVIEHAAVRAQLALCG